MTWIRKAVIVNSMVIVIPEIGRAHVWTPVTVPYLVCRLLLEKKKKIKNKKMIAIPLLHVQIQNEHTHIYITLGLSL